MTHKSKKAFLLAAGGTGGHIIPACRIAKFLQEKFNARILFLGGKKGLESKIVPKWGFDIEIVDIMPMPRRLGLDMLRFPFNLIKATSKAKTIIRSFAPNVIISTGGFASGPSAIAARSLKIPLVLQEQNSYPGITQRWASLWATKVYYSFQGSESFFLSSKNATLLGNPIEELIQDVNRTEILHKLNLSESKKTVFITGGSQGARSINNAILELVKKRIDFNVIWQTGVNNYEAIIKELDGGNLQHIVIEPFIQNMTDIYNVADLVVCRAGALTLAEISALGKPSILVPYPYAAADHQTKNALMFSRSEASVNIKDNELSSELLLLRIKEIINNPSKLGIMSRNAVKLGRPNALRKICEGIIELTGEIE